MNKVPEIEIQEAIFVITGETPFITHRWAEKAKKEIADKQQQVPKLAKEARKPLEEYDAATYFIEREPERWGFPACGFKAACVDAAVALGEKKTETRRAFHVLADAETPDGSLVEIFSEGGRMMREDLVKIGMGTADLRYRPMFVDWSANLRIRYDARQTNVDQIHTLLNQAGFSTGVGEWRVERDGNFGMFRVTSVGLPKKIQLTATQNADAIAKIATKQPRNRAA